MAHGLWVMGYGLWVTVYGVWSMVYGVWCMVYGVWSVVAYHVPALLALLRVVEQLLKSRPVDIPHLWFRAQGSALGVSG